MKKLKVCYGEYLYLQQYGYVEGGNKDGGLEYVLVYFPERNELKFVALRELTIIGYEEV